MGFYRGLTPVGRRNLQNGGETAPFLGKFAALSVRQVVSSSASTPSTMLTSPMKRN